MIVLGVDPGTTESAAVVWDGKGILARIEEENVALTRRIRAAWPGAPHRIDHIAIEQIRGYGLTVGNETFDTVWWTGRFYQAALDTPMSPVMIPRKEIVTWLCDNHRAGDKEVRQALVDKIGPPGTKKEPGPTWGIAGHLWSALAVAVYRHAQLTRTTQAF